MDNKESEIIRELESLSPLLANLKKQQSQQKYDVPRDYFESLENTLLQRVQPAHSAARQTRILHLVRSRWVQAAAVLLLVTGAAWWSLRPSGNPDLPVADVPSEEVIMDYLEQEIGALDEEDFARLIESEDLKELSTPDIPVDDIRNYLENEAINIEDIL